MANKNFFVRNGLTVNNFTTISGTDGTITIGNTSVNSISVSTPNIVVGNVIANTSTLTVGDANINTSSFAIGSNVVSNSSGFYASLGQTGTSIRIGSISTGTTVASVALGAGTITVKSGGSYVNVTGTGVTLPDGNTINGVANTSSFYSNTLNKAVTVDGVWSASLLVTLTDGATITPDLSTGANFVVTLGGNRTVAAPTNAKPGQCGIILVKQDATGSRTLTWNSAWKWSGGVAPILTTTASAVDKIFYIVETSSIIHASAEMNSK